MKRLTHLLPALLMLWIQTAAVAQEMTVSRAKYFRKSQPLAEMEAVLPGPRDRTWKDSLVRNLSFDEKVKLSEQLSAPQPDPVRQALNGPTESRGPSLNFDGVGNVNSVYPPDTDGDVGPDHYFQMINLSFAIFDKQGNKLYGPVNNSTLWSGFAGPWAGTNDGDPIILYDEEADRWFASQFAINTSNGTFWELIAISETGDPLGAYYQYAFEFPAFNDYPKVGIWHDAYYASFNMFGSYLRVAAAAFERDAMLAGNPNARMVLFDLPQNAGPWSMLPADFDGTPPPAGTPNYFAYFTDDGFGAAQDALHFWEFSVDWNNVSNSTFQHAFTLPVAPFDAFFCNMPRGACIPQPNTNQQLETLSDRLMFRLQYRNFGAYQTMVTSHSVDFDGDGHAGVRWYEFRKTGNNPWLVHQQGTYAPDILNRWMPSIAMNGNGTIALGYSVSNENHNPSIRYTGRSAGAPLGTMNYQEVEAITGLSSQSSFGRWGDYAMMSVDPSDDTTFWFTTEYMKYGWKTRIIRIDFGPLDPPSVWAGPDTMLCAVVPYNNIKATSSNFRLVQWNTLGDGSFIRANDTNSIYFQGPNDKLSDSVTLYITAYGYDMVSQVTDTMVLYLSPSPVCNAGKDTLICAGDPAFLHGTAQNYESIVWSTNGDGTFSDIGILNPVYYPGSLDISKGYANLRLTANPLLPCPAPMNDFIKINIQTCTGAGQTQTEEKGIEVYPNPSPGKIHVAMKGFARQRLTLRVHDSAGQELFMQTFEKPEASYTHTLDLGLLPRGTYFVSVEAGGQTFKARAITR